MKYEIIKIHNFIIKAQKRVEHILKDNNILSEKIIYTIPLNLHLYKKLPMIINLKSKKFYKTDINEIKQKYFKLIEL